MTNNKYTVDIKWVCYLQPEQIDNNTNIWFFKKCDSGNNIIKVTVSDTLFLNKIKTGEYKLNYNHTILAELLERDEYINSILNDVVYILIRVILIEREPDYLNTVLKKD